MAAPKATELGGSTGDEDRVSVSRCGSLAMRTAGLAVKKAVPPAARLGLGLPLVGVDVRIELGLGLAFSHFRSFAFYAFQFADSTSTP